MVITYGMYSGYCGLTEFISMFMVQVFGLVSLLHLLFILRSGTKASVGSFIVCLNDSKNFFSEKTMNSFRYRPQALIS